MIERTHTPGPWTADTGDHEGTDILTTHHENCCGVMATIYNQPGKDLPGTVEVANARLIAASPDMLECLHHLINVCVRNDDMSLTLGTHEIRMIEDAVIKATN